MKTKIIILILTLAFFFVGCRTSPQRKELTKAEKQQIRQKIILDFYCDWRFKESMKKYFNEKEINN